MPPQRLVDGGAVRIVVVHGAIERVDADALPRRVRAAVTARFRPLIGRREVTLAQLERQVLLAGEVAGVTLRSTLARGEAVGGVRLIVEGKWRRIERARKRGGGGVRLIVEGKWRPFRASVRADNAIDRSLADANGSLQLSLNGVLGLG